MNFVKLWKFDEVGAQEVVWDYQVMVEGHQRVIEDHRDMVLRDNPMVEGQMYMVGGCREII